MSGPGPAGGERRSGAPGRKGGKGTATWIFFALYALFILASLATGFETGMTVGANLLLFSREMLGLLPPIFILIGLFEVWVPQRIVERHLGAASGLLGHLWAVLLAGTSVGGLYVAFPVAFALRQKGARLAVILTYIGASGICRIPMTIFEATFIGVGFTLVRYAVSLPLLVASSELLGRLLERRNITIRDGGG